MEKNKKQNYRKTSLFVKWEIGIIAAVILVLIAYLIISGLGLIEEYQHAVDYKYATLNNSWLIYNIAVSFTFVAITIAAIAYISISIYILLSHRSVEDSRLHCLPIIISPIFLVIENGFLHLFGENYYEITMSIFSATVVGVITFASLKFSFQLSSQHKILTETSKVKPNITVTPGENNKYTADISQYGCYLSGAYIGKIDKIFYRDIKKTGNQFSMHSLFYPNIKAFFEKGISHEIDFSTCNEHVNSKYISFLDAYKALHELNEELDFYWIFRDTRNYYYFVQMPTDKVPYNAIGVNEHMMTRLLYYHNKNQSKKEKRRKNTIFYNAMDWFKIPYNFYPENP